MPNNQEKVINSSSDHFLLQFRHWNAGNISLPKKETAA
jgi:hypothetical protein